jgi:hypothetical protein
MLKPHKTIPIKFQKTVKCKKQWGLWCFWFILGPLSLGVQRNKHGVLWSTATRSPMADMWTVWVFLVPLWLEFDGRHVDLFVCSLVHCHLKSYASFRRDPKWLSVPGNIIRSSYSWRKWREFLKGRWWKVVGQGFGMLITQHIKRVRVRKG